MFILYKIKRFYDYRDISAIINIEMQKRSKHGQTVLSRSHDVSHEIYRHNSGDHFQDAVTGLQMRGNFFSNVLF